MIFTAHVAGYDYGSVPRALQWGIYDFSWGFQLLAKLSASTLEDPKTERSSTFILLSVKCDASLHYFYYNYYN